MAKKSTKNETLVLSPVLPEVKIYKHDDFCERLAKLLPSYPRPNIELVRILRYKLRNDPKNAISTKQYNDFHNRIDPLLKHLQQTEEKELQNMESDFFYRNKLVPATIEEIKNDKRMGKVYNNIKEICEIRKQWYSYE